MSSSEEYWKKRAEERESEWTKKSKTEIEQEIKKLYTRALINIKKDINDLYEKFADENGLSMAEAKKLITGNEYTVWRMDIEDYIQKSELDNKLLRELNTLAMKSRIGRLDKLYGEILLELAKMAEGYDDKLTDYLKTSLTDNYYHTTFDICKGLNILLPVSILDTETVEDIIKTPWSGKQFSKRIWNNTDTLAKVLKQEISNAMIRGVNSREMAQVISKKMDSSYKQAMTLVRSELNYVNNQSSLKSIKDAGGKKYRFIATLDSRTSMICRQMDGTIHETKKGVPGTNMPPMHPRCRSTIAITNLTSSSARKRISRVNGEIRYVPADMKYTDWEKVYVKKTITFDEWEKVNKKSKSETNNKSTLKELIKNTDIKNCSKGDIINIGRKVCEQFDIKNKIGDKEALKEIFSNFREMGGKLSSEQWAKGSNKITKQQLSEAFSYYPKDWVNYLTDSGKKLYTLITNRGFFNEGAVMANGKYYATKFPDYKTGYVSIHMNGMRKTTPYHEIGHYVEYFNKNALRISKEFLKDRTKDEKSVLLREILFNSRYKKDETTKPDDFISPYIGKDYPDASEVLSVGLELVFEPTKQLKKVELINGEYKPIYATIKDDIEFLYLIIGLILKA